MTGRHDKQAETIKIDLATGKQEVGSMPYVKSPPGYTWFIGGRAMDLHPLIASKKLRFEYLGKTRSVHRPSRNYDGDWSVANEKYFTGTRRIVYGSRPLLEQNFVNYVGLIGIESYVRIEPDGDRIVCMCTDLRGTWLAIFSTQKLEAEQKRGWRK